MVDCKFCSESISNVSGESIVCNGVCKLLMCRRCSGLTKVAIKNVSEFPNMKFYCNGCMAFSCTEFSSSLEGVKASIMNLSETVSESTKNIVSLITRPSNCNPVSIVVPEISSPAVKGMRVDDLQGTPMSSQRNNCVVGSVEDSVIRTIEQRKLVIASLFHPSTKEDELCKYIRNGLHLDESDKSIRCNLLLPAGRKLEELDFVSFKVSVPESMYLSLFEPSLWPKGVKVREFMHRNKTLTKRNFGHFLPPLVPTIPVVTAPQVTLT